MEKSIRLYPGYVGKLYGIELEIESAGLYEDAELYDEETQQYYTESVSIPKNWQKEIEESICGAELVSQGAFDYLALCSNIDVLFRDIHSKGYRPIRTPRGSTHVHANVGDLTWQQFRHFIVTCAWVEPALIELAGKGRKGNLFAHSYNTMPIGWHMITSWCQSEQMTVTLDTHYMATNFAPANTLGSVEFRMGPSSRTAEEAITWLTYIDYVVSEARTAPTTCVEPPACLSVLIDNLPRQIRDRVVTRGRANATEIWPKLQKRNQQALSPPAQFQTPKPLEAPGENFESFLNDLYSQLTPPDSITYMPQFTIID